jgi:hypothetical protein
MSQVYFSQSPLSAGQTSRTFTLPAGMLVMSVNRYLTARLADGTAETDIPVTITLRQLLGDGSFNTIATVNSYGGSVGVMADPNGGVCSIVNSGPGRVSCVSIGDGDR